MNSGNLHTCIAWDESRGSINAKVNPNSHYNLIGLRTLLRLVKCPSRALTVAERRRVLNLINKEQSIELNTGNGIIKTLGSVPSEINVGQVNVNAQLQVLPREYGEIGVMIGMDTAIETGLPLPDIDTQQENPIEFSLPSRANFERFNPERRRFPES